MSATPKVRQVPIDDIELDKRCQARVALDGVTVQAYADLYRDDVKLPALDVFEVDGVLYLVDGFHRLAALRTIEEHYARVRVVGSSTEIEHATLAALKANHTHGLRRSRADKRRAVWMALDAGLYEDLGSERAMAKDLGVSRPFVAKVRKEWEAEQGGNVATPTDHDEPTEESADTDREPDSDTEPAADEPQAAPEGCIDRQLTNEYARAAKGLQRVHLRLCEGLGAADPVCVKVNEAKRLAEAEAEGVRGA